jgi:NhaP-type Na+/H+ or K+/H+ antiporter
MLTILLNAALVLVGGYLAGQLVQKICLPGLLGMMLFGILIGPQVMNLLGQSFLEQAPNISVFALMVVITSSFFAIDLQVLRRSSAVVALNLTKSDLNNQEKLFVGLSTLGKATVQATLGPLVIANGIQNGETILAIAVMAILVMAPVAGIAIEFSYRKLLNQAEPSTLAAAAQPGN